MERRRPAADRRPARRPVRRVRRRPAQTQTQDRLRGGRRADLADRRAPGDRGHLCAVPLRSLGLQAVLRRNPRRDRVRRHGDRERPAVQGAAARARRGGHLGSAGGRAVHPRRLLHRAHQADRRDARRHRRQRRALQRHGPHRPLPLRLLQLRPRTRRRDDRARPSAGHLGPGGRGRAGQRAVGHRRSAGPAGGRPAAGDPQQDDAVPLRPFRQQTAVRRDPPGDRAIG